MPIWFRWKSDRLANKVRRERTIAYWKKKGVVNEFKLMDLIRRYGLKSEEVLVVAGV